jgi:ABC-type multidrug transport system fused ATPase/permease subunit
LFSGGDQLNFTDIDKIDKNGLQKKDTSKDNKYSSLPTTTTTDPTAENDIEMATCKSSDTETESTKQLINRSVKTLCNASFEIKKGQLVAIVGSVGSGKSSLLSALLGEMHCVSGEVQVHGSVAYCDQRAWILNDTVEGNILFGQEYNEEKFDNALYSANLEDDIKTLEGGLHTQIGECEIVQFIHFDNQCCFLSR